MEFLKTVLELEINSMTKFCCLGLEDVDLKLIHAVHCEYDDDDGLGKIMSGVFVPLFYASKVRCGMFALL